MARKLRADAPRVMTANCLLDGVVVYRTADGRWTPHLDQAHVVTAQAAQDALLATCRDDEAACLVVGLDVIEVEADPATGPRPISQRETIRATGPTITLPLDRPIQTPPPHRDPAPQA